MLSPFALALLFAASAASDPGTTAGTGTEAGDSTATAPTGAEAGSAALALRNGFTPHPFTAELKVPNGTSTMTARGYGKCSQAPTSDEPAFTFTVEEPITDLRLHVDAPAALVQPDRSFICVTSGSVWLRDWAPGRYQLLLFGTSPELKAHVRLEQPVRAQTELKAALEATPELVLTSTIPANPAYHELKPVQVFVGHAHGVGCGPEALAPLARIKVPYPSSWDFVSRNGAALVLVPATGGCRTQLRGVELEAGDYVLWVAPEAGSQQKSWELAIADESRPLRFGEAPVHDLGLLKKPVALAGKTSDKSWGPVRKGTCKDLPRTPSFYLRGPKGLKNVELTLWRDAGLGTRARFGVYGPLESPGPGAPMRCDLARPTFRTLEGTYAVFVDGGEQPSQDIVVLARRVDVALDYAALPVAVPEPLPVAERALAKYYPWFREGLDARRFFLTAPPQLFIATAGGNTPLLVIQPRELTLDVLRMDGAVETLGASEVKDSVSRPPGLPTTLPAPAPVMTVEEAIAAAGPAEAGFVAKFHAVEGAINGCVSRWLAKNDPHWAASDELLRLTTAEPAGERIVTGADKVCGVKRLDGAGKLLIKQVNASRARNAKAFLAALKRRFK